MIISQVSYRTNGPLVDETARSKLIDQSIVKKRRRKKNIERKESLKISPLKISRDICQIVQL